MHHNITEIQAYFPTYRWEIKIISDTQTKQAMTHYKDNIKHIFQNTILPSISVPLNGSPVAGLISESLGVCGTVGASSELQPSISRCTRESKKAIIRGSSLVDWWL